MLVVSRRAEISPAELAKREPAPGHHDRPDPSSFALECGLFRHGAFLLQPISLLAFFETAAAMAGL
jgi:hypothetical protein